MTLEQLEPRLTLSGSGLTAQYFHNADFTGLAGTRVESPAFDWGNASPGFGLDADTFSVRWTGQIQPQFSELYTFRIVSDEGVRLWVDGQLIIDSWTPHTARVNTGTIALQAGGLSDLRIEYFDISGPARMELSWSSASQALEVIPASRLFESPSGLLGTYYDSIGGSLTRVDSTIDFNWGILSPGAGVARDNITVNWTGQIRAGYGEEYTFSTISDEGVRLRIGGELIIDNWTSHPPTQDFGVKRLEPGKWYDIRLEYFDESGNAQIALQWSSSRQTGDGVFEVVPQENLRAISTHTFTNPLGAGADPFVIQSEGSYYMTRSAGNSVWIDRADSLQDIHSSNSKSDSILAWSAPAGTNYSKQIWAPELHRLGSSWYIYVAASNGDNATHRMHVLVRNAESPFGPYNYLGQITPATDRWAIDGTVLSWDGKLYFLWSGWPGFSNGQQNLYIAEMRTPWILGTDRVLLSSPQFSWETHGLAINEGPQVLIENDQLHIIYSASGYWTPQYALGRLTYDGVGSLLDPSSWTKSAQPVFQANSFVVGTGHASFTKSPDGQENWIVYHAHANPTVFNEDRVIRIQPFRFRSDGTPDFGEPLPNSLALPVPSTGAEPERSFLTGDYNADGVVDGLDHAVWAATFGPVVYPGTGADGNNDGVVDTADYVLWRRFQGIAAASVALSDESDHASDPQSASAPVPMFTAQNNDLVRLDAPNQNDEQSGRTHARSEQAMSPAAATFSRLTPQRPLTTEELQLNSNEKWRTYVDNVLADWEKRLASNWQYENDEAVLPSVPLLDEDSADRHFLGPHPLDWHIFESAVLDLTARE